MGFRPDLDLSNILQSFDQRHFQEDAEEKPRHDVPEQGGLKYPVPQRLGWGPDVWSASMELAVPVVLCWDVNGYYAALGVSPRATRKELREAYQARNGQKSPYLTYVFKQLLDPVRRAAYDAAPLGQLYLDEYTQMQLKLRARKEAQRRLVRGEFTTSEKVMGEWGYAVEDEDEGVDSVSPTRQDLPRKNGRWGYSYYGWKTTKFLPDEALLQRWQNQLATAATQLGITPRLSFGITAMSDQPYILEQVGDQTVIFFSEEGEPTDSVAREAIEHLIQTLQTLQITHNSPSYNGDPHGHSH